MDFLELTGKTILVFGVANRKSVAYAIARTVEDAGAQVVYVVQDDEARQRVGKLVGEREIYVCDVEFEEQIERLRSELAARGGTFHGLVHSIAFADYRGRHEAVSRDGQEAVPAGHGHLVLLADPPVQRGQGSAGRRRLGGDDFHFDHADGQRELRLTWRRSKRPSIRRWRSWPKSFSRFSRVRFNAVAPGLLKTSASAGIPGYVDSYLYAEQVIPRGQAVQTQEVANVAAFLLSPRSSGITAQSMVIDAGMSINYFDRRDHREGGG